MTWLNDIVAERQQSMATTVNGLKWSGYAPSTAVALTHLRPFAGRLRHPVLPPFVDARPVA